MEELEKQAENKPKRDKNGRLLPGYTANPNGRPKGISFTERIKEIFLNEPEKFEATCKYYMDDPRMKELLWKMIDGMPKQQTEIKGKQKILVIPSELINKYDIQTPDSSSKSEDSSQR